MGEARCREGRVGLCRATVIGAMGWLRVARASSAGSAGWAQVGRERELEQRSVEIGMGVASEVAGGG